MFRSIFRSLSSSLLARTGRPIWEKTPDGFRFGWSFSNGQPDDVELSASMKSKNVDVKVGATFG
jgi:hypothetical protein